MNVSQILSYVMALIDQLGLTPYIQASIVLVLAGIGISSLISVLKNR